MCVDYIYFNRFGLAGFLNFFYLFFSFVSNEYLKTHKKKIDNIGLFDISLCSGELILIIIEIQSNNNFTLERVCVSQIVVEKKAHQINEYSFERKKKISSNS